MGKKLCILLVAAAFALPVGAGAATITASQTSVNAGTTVLDLTLDPEGVTTGAWLVALSSVGLSIDSISSVVPGGTDCFGLTAASSFDAQCANLPLTGVAVVAQVTITGQAGDTLSLFAGNITDFNTFEDTLITPGVLATVVPEPGSLALATLGLLGLAWSGRHRRF